MYETLCFYAILARPDLFGEFFCLTREGRPFERLYYQTPWLLDPTCAVVTGRDTGKSLVMTIRSAHHKVVCSGSSELTTSVDESRVKARFEEVFGHFASNDILRNYFLDNRGDVGVVRTPRFLFTSKNKHVLSGVIPGLQGNNYRQFHTDALCVEEASLFVHDDLTALRGTRNPDNPYTQEFWAGVPDGRINSPFWDVCHDNERFHNHVYNVAKWAKPIYTVNELRKDLESYGRRTDSNDFLHEVRGVTGDPTSIEFIPQDILACQDVGWLSAKVYRRHVISRSMWEAVKDPGPLLSRLPDTPPEAEEVWQAVDVGTATKTVAGTFTKVQDRWYLIHILELREIRDLDAQRAILESYQLHFGATKVGIDTTEGAGLSLAQSLRYIAPMVPVNFSSPIEVPTPDVVRRFKVYEWGVKEIADMMAKREFGLPRDRTLYEEFTNFSIKKRGQFHTVAMFIVFVALKHLTGVIPAQPPQPQGAAAIPSEFGDALALGGFRGPI